MKSNFFKFIHCNQFQFRVQGNDAHTKKFKTLKSWFINFQSCRFIFSHLQVHYLPFNTFFLFLYLILNTRSTQKQAKIILYLKSYARYQKMQFCIELYIVWKIFPYIQANPYQLKNKNTNSLIIISTNIT